MAKDVFKSPLDQSDSIIVGQENESRKGGNKHPNVFYVDKNNKKWTYDDPEIKKAFVELNRRGLEEPTMAQGANGELIDYRDDARKAKGDQWIKEETADQTAKYKPLREKRIHFIFGNGGTGKSSYIKNIGLNDGAYLMDSDEFVENRIDDTNDSNPERALNTFKVHEESSYLRDKMFEPLIAEGYNIVSPKVKPKLSDIKKFKDLGYRVGATFLDADLDTSLNRGLKRYVDQRKRLVPTSAYVPQDKLRKMWQEVVDSGLLDEYYDYDASDPTYKLRLLNSFKK